jgi:hypothetical protein
MVDALVGAFVSLTAPILKTLSQRVKEREAEPGDDTAPRLKRVFGYTHEKGRDARQMIFLDMRVNVTEATAKALDLIAPDGLIALPWAHGGEAEISYEHRAAKRHLRVTGLPDSMDPCSFRAGLERSGFKVDKVEPVRHPGRGHALIVNNRLDVTFCAGSPLPPSISVRGDNGQVIQLGLFTPRRAQPATVDMSKMDKSKLVPLSYAAAASKPAAPKPPAAAAPAPRGPTPAGRRDPAPAKRRRPGPAPKPSAGGAAARVVAKPPSPKPAETPICAHVVELCHHCGSPDHALEVCPNRGTMDWAPADEAAPCAADTLPAGGEDLDMDVPNGAAPETGKQSPLAVETASPSPDGR